MSVKFISNTNDKHYDYLNELIKDSDEVWMAVAFLKKSGLKFLWEAIVEHLNKGNTINIIVGLNFGITNPEALETLLDLFEGNNKANLYLAKAEKMYHTFHPKLYVFGKDDDFTIISGSANLTEGGISTNIECSMQVKTQRDDTVHKDTFDFINKLLSKEFSAIATTELINKYKVFYKEQKQIRKEVKKVSKTKTLNFDGINIYKLMLTQVRSIIKKCHEDEFVGIDYKVGYDLTNDLLKGKEKFIEHLLPILQHNRPDKKEHEESCDEIWNFATAKIGDIVICPDKKQKKGGFYVGKITDVYYFEESFGIQAI